MTRILVAQVGRGAAGQAGVPEDLASSTRVLLVLEDGDGVERGDILLVGGGGELGLYRRGGGLELVRGGGDGAIARGSIIGILRKFK
jgi:hypothetical protein